MRKDFKSNYFFYSPDSLSKIFVAAERSDYWNKIRLQRPVFYKDVNVKNLEGLYGKKVFVRGLRFKVNLFSEQAKAQQLLRLLYLDIIISGHPAHPHLIN